MKHTELLLALVPRGTLHPPLLVFRSGECNNADRGAPVSGRTQHGPDPGAARPQPHRPVELGCWLEKGHPPCGFRQGLCKYGSAGALSAVRAPVSRGWGLLDFGWAHHWTGRLEAEQPWRTAPRNPCVHPALCRGVGLRAVS